MRLECSDIYLTPKYHIWFQNTNQFNQSKVVSPNTSARHLLTALHISILNKGQGGTWERWYHTISMVRNTAEKNLKSSFNPLRISYFFQDFCLLPKEGRKGRKAAELQLTQLHTGHGGLGGTCKTRCYSSPFGTFGAGPWLQDPAEAESEHQGHVAGPARLLIPCLWIQAVPTAISFQIRVLTHQKGTTLVIHRGITPPVHSYKQLLSMSESTLKFVVLLIYYNFINCPAQTHQCSGADEAGIMKSSKAPTTPRGDVPAQCPQPAPCQSKLHRNYLTVPYRVLWMYVLNKPLIFTVKHLLT